MQIEVSYKQIIIFSLILIVSTVVNETVAGFLWTGIQYGFVIYLLIKNKKEDAIFWHFIFMITGTAYSSVALDEATRSNYFAMKLYGPVTLSYVFSIFLLIISPPIESYKKQRYELFYKMRQYFLILGIGGVLLGSIGCLVSDYYVSELVGFTVYIAVVAIHIELLLRNEKGSLLKKCFDSCIPLLIASIVNNVFNLQFGYTTTYSIYEIYKESSLSTFALLLLLAVPIVKNKTVVIGSLIIYVIMTLSIASGKFFFNIMSIGFVYVLKLIEDKNVKHRSLLLVLTSFTFLAILAAPIALEGKAASKFSQFTSIFSSKGDLSNVENSPYVRMVEMLNIYNENIHNPIYFFVGRGYGGYFSDNLHVMDRIEFGDGSFRDEFLIRNKYPTGHNTFSTVPLLNGFGGLTLVLILVVQYVKRGIRYNYLGGISILWLLFMFYYNVLLGLIGVFFLFSSEYNYSNVNNNKQNQRLRLKSAQ